MRAPNHGRPWEYPYDGQHGRWDYADTSRPNIEVAPADEKPKVALYGPKGEPLRYFAKRPIGYRSTKKERT